MKKKVNKYSLDEEIQKEFDYVNYNKVDLNNVDFSNKNKVHEWKNYIEDIYIRHWNELTDREKKIIYISCKEQADREEWD